MQIIPSINGTYSGEKNAFLDHNENKLKGRYLCQML